MFCRVSESRWWRSSSVAVRQPRQRTNGGAKGDAACCVGRLPNYLWAIFRVQHCTYLRQNTSCSLFVLDFRRYIGGVTSQVFKVSGRTPYTRNYPTTRPVQLPAVRTWRTPHFSPDACLAAYPDNSSSSLISSLVPTNFKCLGLYSLPTRPNKTRHVQTETSPW